MSMPGCRINTGESVPKAYSLSAPIDPTTLVRAVFHSWNSLQGMIMRELTKGVGPTRIAVFRCLFSLLLLATFTSSWAQQKQKYVYTGSASSKYVEQHAIDVGDVSGHQIRVARLQTTYGTDGPSLDGVKVVETSTSLSSDYVDGSGRFTTYSVLKMANGDKVYERGESLARTTIADDGAKKTTFSQVFTLTGGTGKFATIRGTLRATGATDFKSGTSDNVTEGEYWFEK